MSESGLIQHLCEFFSKLWMPIFSQLLGKSYELKENNLRKLSDYISSVLYDSDLSVLNFLNDKFDIILDVFHIVYNFYCLKDGKSSTCLINCDSIMNERGLKKNKSGAGRRGGYKNLERQKIHNALWILNLCGVLIVRELKSYKYVINIPARIYSLPQYIFPKKLVMYNYKSHIWHRRFGFYLIKNKSKHVKVAHLLGTVKNLHSSFKPLQLRDKFENVLDSLCEDGIIHNWHYKSIDENLLCGKNWIKHWKNLVIYVGIINY